MVWPIDRFGMAGWVCVAGAGLRFAAALSPLPLRLEGLVDGRNRPAAQEALDGTFAPTRKAYQSRPDRLTMNREIRGGAAAWLSERLSPEQ